jgi:hypothetical protein
MTRSRHRHGCQLSDNTSRRVLHAGASVLATGPGRISRIARCRAVHGDRRRNSRRRADTAGLPARQRPPGRLQRRHRGDRHDGVRSLLRRRSRNQRREARAAAGRPAAHVLGPGRHPERLPPPGRRRRPHRRDRGRVRIHERRVGPGRVPRALRATPVQHGQRLLHQGRPERRDHLPGRGPRVVDRNCSGPGRGVLGLPRLPHPARPGRRQQLAQPRHGRGHSGAPGRRCDLELLRRCR